MAKAEWGTKRICTNCGARFYDMRREPIVCPSCGTVYNPDVAAKPRRAARPAAAVVASKSPAVAVAADDEVEVVEDVELDAEELEDEDEADAEAEETADETEEDEDSEAMIEDASELGEDDAMSDVIDTGLEDEDER